MNSLHNRLERLEQQARERQIRDEEDPWVIGAGTDYEITASRRLMMTLEEWRQSYLQQDRSFSAYGARVPPEVADAVVRQMDERLRRAEAAALEGEVVA